MNACKADNPEKPTVIIPANEFSLPKVLRHLEAGKIVLIIPAHRHPRQRLSSEERGSPGITRVSLCHSARLSGPTPEAQSVAEVYDAVRGAPCPWSLPSRCRLPHYT